MKRFIERIFNYLTTYDSFNEFIHKRYFKYKLRTVKKRMVTEQKPKLLFAPVPILNNKYWSKALQEKGYEAKTLMATYYSSICKKEDFDLYFDEVVRSHKQNVPLFIRIKFPELVLLDYVIENYDIIHIPYSGLFFQGTKYEDFELQLLKKAGIKIIILPYGADSYLYSKVINLSLRHGLLLSYPEAAKSEPEIQRSHVLWTKNADITFSGYFVDGVRRWDILPFSILTIDTEKWSLKRKFSDHDGSNGTVNIIHTPNHRGFKGTEFIIAAVEDLKKEGLKINLILLEKKQNEEVKRIMQEEADILVEQLLIGYALSGIEGMSTGLAVISNLDDENYTRLFRRFSFLNECPILSGTPENIKQKLKLLVTNPALRKELGMAGRKYAEKYHSYQSCQYFFGKIYEKIWYGKDVDLMNLYHPLLQSSYNNRFPKVEHPLIDNKFPAKADQVS